MTKERWQYIKNLSVSFGEYIHISKHLVRGALGLMIVSPARGSTYRKAKDAD